MRIEFDPKNRRKTFRKSVRVKTNGQPRETVLRIKGYIIPDPNKLNKHIGELKINRAEFNFGNIKDNEELRDSILVGNYSDEVIKLQFTGTDEFASIFELSMSDNELKQGETGFIYCKLKINKQGNYGFNRHRIKFNDINNPQRTQGNLQITYNKEEDFSAWSDEQKLNAPRIELFNSVCDFGERRQNEVIECEFMYKNAGKSDLIVRGIRSASFVTEKSIDKVIAPGEEGRIVLTVNLKRTVGNFVRYITLISNSPGRSKNKLTIRGKVIDR